LRGLDLGLSFQALFAALAAAVLPLASGCGGEGEVEQPAPLYGNVPIDYPLQLWDQGMEGQTLLRVRVTDTGRVDSVEVVESSGEPAFDSAAVNGARDLRFRPARRDGKRIEVWARVPVHFSKRPRPDTVGGWSPLTSASENSIQQGS
jgi:TonB family protein